MAMAAGVIGAVMQGIGSFLSADKEKSALESLKLNKPLYETPETAQQQFASQLGQLPAVAGLLGNASTMDNNAIRARIEAADPGALKSTAAASQLAFDRSMGGLQSDTVDAIQRANAYAAMQGGYGGSQMSDDAMQLKTAQARMNAINQAPGLNQTAMSYAQELAPVNPDVGATLLSPGAILQRQDQLANYNSDIINQQRLGDLAAKMGSANQQGSMLTTGIGGLTGGINNLIGNWGSWQNNMTGDPNNPAGGMSWLGSSISPTVSTGGSWP